MNPTTGTFISMDTYQGSNYDPITLHKYLYANANPVTYCDPSGYTASMAEHKSVMAISNIIDSAASKAASFAWNYYLKFKASIPTIITAVTGMATFVSNNPAFLDICARFASGDMSIYELQQMLIETFNNIHQSVLDHIYEATNRVHSSSSSGSSGGGNGVSGNFDPNKLQELINKLCNKVNDISQRKLQHEYKHAKDFGIEGNWNSKNGDQFYEAILEHIKNAPQTINGTYRGSGVVHYFDPVSKVDVMVDLQNNFVCGWKLSPDQVSYLLSTGNIC